MSHFNIKTVNQKQRFGIATLLGLLTGSLLGFAVGFIRSIPNFNISIFIIIIGYGVATVVRYFGRGIQLKFSLVACLATILGILISDVIATFGVAGLMVAENYQITLKFMYQQDMYTLVWVIYRALAIYIAYNYSRIL